MIDEIKSIIERLEVLDETLGYDVDPDMHDLKAIPDAIKLIIALGG